MSEINPYQVRKLVLQFCQYISDRHFTLLPNLFAPDSTWTAIADPNRASYGGTVSASDQIARFDKLLGGFEHFSFEAMDVVVEDNKAVVDVEIKGSGPGKESYENTYLMWVVTDEKGQKIKSVKQSLDCYRVEAWIESKKL